MKVLTIGDLHLPAARKGYLQFCKDIKKKYRCNEVVFIGDVVDWHAISNWEKEPNCPGPRDEYQLAKGCVKEWYKAFPKAKVCLGNHDERPARLAKSVHIPDFLLKPYGELWLTPNWDWDFSFNIDNVHYRHGTGISGIHPAWNLMNKIKSSVVIGHCLSGDTEVLTPVGWRPLPQVNIGDRVITKNSIGLLNWSPVRKLMRDTSVNYLNKIHTQHVDIEFTDKHRMMYLTDSNRRKVAYDLGVDFIKRSRTRVLTGGYLWPQLHAGLETLRLMVWILADGSKDKHQIRFHLKKPRKIMRLTSLLEKMEIPYNSFERTDDTTSIDINKSNLTHIESLMEDFKTMPEWFIHLGRLDAETILEEYGQTDGTKYDSCYQISSSKEREIDILQAMLTLNGYRAIKLNRDLGRFILTVTKSTSTLITMKNSVDRIKYTDDAYCVSVDNGNVLTRHNGRTMFTGNCHSRAGIKWSVNPFQRFFAMDVGCGISEKTWQFAYGKDLVERPICSCGVVLDGIPYLEIMPIGKNEKYYDENF